MRPVGDILLEMEPLLFELTETHQLQLGEMLCLFERWARIHYPGCVEQYQDDTEPVSFYGPEEELIKLAERLKKRRSKEKCCKK